jgi:hypothetical protein
LEDGNDKILGAIQTINDTEALATDITVELSEQKEKIQASSEKVKAVDAKLTTAGKMVATMSHWTRRWGFKWYAYNSVVFKAFITANMYDFNPRSLSSAFRYAEIKNTPRPGRVCCSGYMLVSQNLCLRVPAQATANSQSLCA